MSRILYLLRHAQSADKQPSQPDKERELTPQGMRDALAIGGYIYRQKINLDLILSSTAMRATHSAELMADAAKVDLEKIRLEEELYTASIRTFLNLINQQEDTNHSIMYVGHNPVISYLAEYLTKEEIGDLPPAGLVVIRCQAAHWKDISQGSGELMTNVTPGNF